MTKEHMNHLLDTRPGIGVEAITSAGNVLHYFYEDFGPDFDGQYPDGIDRAMNQLYPLMNKGFYTNLTFIERSKLLSKEA